MTVIETPVVLGEEYTDWISGFKGVAIGIAVYMYGCRQILLSKRSDKESDDKSPQAEWFDEQRLTDESPKPEAGGPQLHAPQRH